MKECYGKCERCAWMPNGGCSEWNGYEEAMRTFRYVVNTFQDSVPVQAEGEIVAQSEWDVVNRLVVEGVISAYSYEFLELEVME